MSDHSPTPAPQPTLAPALKLNHDGRDWPEDFAHENGQYYNICTDCGKGFVGHKRRFVCKLCAPAAPQEGTTPPPDKRTAGLYGKYKVTRTDGTDAPGMKHDACEYFVLDLTHDPFAIPAIRAYAAACAAEYPALAADLLRYAKVAGLAAIIPEYFGEQKR